MHNSMHLKVTILKKSPALFDYQILYENILFYNKYISHSMTPSAS
jgi:hypothetical protein